MRVRICRCVGLAKPRAAMPGGWNLCRHLPRLLGFIVYSTWAGLLERELRVRAVPVADVLAAALRAVAALAGSAGRRSPTWWPSFLHYSAAALILWGPVGFRLTCYYYRGAYYKAFWADPPGCAVGEPRKKYLGERSFPLVIQNIHRYFLYVAIVFIVVLAYDAWKAMWFPVGDRRRSSAGAPTEFGIGVGTIVLTAERRASSRCYTFGCHSLRHLVGGVLRRDVGPAGAQDGVRLRQLPQPLAHEVGVDQPDLGRLHGSLRPDVRDGHLDTICRTVLMDMNHPVIEHDVLVIGAGGAGLARGDRSVGARRQGRRHHASRCSARRTPSWPKAAWRRRWPTSTTATAGACTSPTRCAAAST